MKMIPPVRCAACGALIAAALLGEHACEQHGQELVCEPARIEQQHVVERTPPDDERPIAATGIASGGSRNGSTHVRVRETLALALNILPAVVVARHYASGNFLGSLVQNS